MRPSGWNCSNKTWRKLARAICAKLQARHRGDKDDKSTLPLLSLHSLLLGQTDIECGKKPISERDMHAPAKHYKIDPDSLAQPPDCSLLLDAPTHWLLDYSYTVLSNRPRGQFNSFLRSFIVKRR